MLAENYTLVAEDDIVGKLEAFKMESDIVAPGAGTLVWMTDIGAYVNEGDLLAIISEETTQPEAPPTNDRLQFWDKQIAAAENTRRPKQD